mgnify:CR=1 FL=1
MGDFNLLLWSKKMKELNLLFNGLSNPQYTFPSNYPLIKYDYFFYDGFQTEPLLQIKENILSVHTPYYHSISLKES